MASEECPIHDNDVPPINLVSPSHNELIIQGTNGGGPAHCVVLPSGIDGVDIEGNVPVSTLENNNMLNVAFVGIQEVAIHPMPISQAWQLSKSSANVPQRSVCIQPPMHPTYVGQNPSSHVRASNIMESNDEIYLACLQSFQKNHASLALEMAFP